MCRSWAHNFLLSKQRFLVWLYDESGKRTITVPADGAAIMSSSELRTELQTLENEVAHTSTGHRHDGTDAKLLPSATPTNIAIGDSTTIGSNSSYSKSDHRHGAPTSAAPITQALGDVAAEGGASTFAKTDHRHGMPAEVAGGEVPTGAIILWSGASCPSTYTRVSALDNKFLVSASSYNGSAGGNNSVTPTGSIGSDGAHTHSVPAHTVELPSRGNFDLSAFEIGTSDADSTMLVQSTTTSVTSTIRRSDSSSDSGTLDSNGAHTHALTVNAVDTRPAFATVLLCKKD